MEKFKLAGFKSCMDPTIAYFPGNLVGVVGLNGCGKSNVIDAVRWVMGESATKMLRGESLADVIFNGSKGRRPVRTARIEMVFDNGVELVLRAGVAAKFGVTMLVNLAMP